jgi:hypothetical protein
MRHLFSEIDSRRVSTWVVTVTYRTTTAKSQCCRKQRRSSGRPIRCDCRAGWASSFWKHPASRRVSSDDSCLLVRHVSRASLLGTGGPQQFFHVGWAAVGGFLGGRGGERRRDLSEILAPVEDPARILCPGCPAGLTAQLATLESSPSVTDNQATETAPAVELSALFPISRLVRRDDRIGPRNRGCGCWPLPR